MSHIVIKIYHQYLLFSWVGLCGSSTVSQQMSANVRSCTPVPIPGHVERIFNPVHLLSCPQATC